MLLKPRIAGCIPLRAISHVVPSPIHFHRNRSLTAVEVEHVRFDQMLSPELEPARTHAKNLP